MQDNLALRLGKTNQRRRKMNIPRTETAILKTKSRQTVVLHLSKSDENRTLQAPGDPTQHLSTRPKRAVLSSMWMAQQQADRPLTMIWLAYPSGSYPRTRPSRQFASTPRPTSLAPGISAKFQAVHKERRNTSRKRTL